MPKILPDSPYFFLTDLAKDWGCSEEKIIDYGIREKLKICALGGYWTLQEGYYSDDAPDGFPVPTEGRGTGLMPIPLTCFALRQILRDGEVTDPEFIFEADGIENQGKDEEQFDRFLSSVLISNRMDNTRSKIVVKKADLVIRQEDAEMFLSTYAEKDREVLQNALSLENKAALPVANAVKPQKQKRRHELHELIGKIIVELGFKDSQAPSNDIWNHLRKEKERYECIQEIDDKIIWWRTLRGSERKMERMNFNNIVSQYNNDKRPYPEN